MTTAPTVVAAITDLSELPDQPGIWVARGDWRGAYVARLDDHRWVGVTAFIFTYAVVWGWIGDPHAVHEERWCYPTPGQAFAAAATWDGTGDPADGWLRHFPSGRRRTNGDPTTERTEP
jgi:hypothetical protein